MGNRVVHELNTGRIESYFQRIVDWSSDISEIIPDATPEFKLDIYEKGVVIEREFIDGDIFVVKKMEFTEGIKLAYMILGTLSAFHRLGIPHMNIKPENILIQDDRVVLLDPMPPDYYDFLGIDDNELKKKLRYGPPEAAVGYRSDCRADIYRLGVILYEIFTGENPFVTVDPVLEGKKHISHNLNEPHLIEPELPEYLSSVLMRMVAKYPEERFPDADSVIGALIRKESLPPPSKAKFFEIPDTGIEYVDKNMERIVIIIVLLFIFSIIFILSEYLRWSSIV